MNFLPIFTTGSCDTTQSSRLLPVVTHFPVILQLFSGQNIEFWDVFQFQNQANFERLCNTPKKNFQLGEIRKTAEKLL